MGSRRMVNGRFDHRLSFAVVMLMVMIFSNSNLVVESQVARGMFVFGDSLADVGNNNYLASIAKSNYYPYGIDFELGPTGRFSNGKTFVDIIGRMIGMPYPPAFADPNTNGTGLLQGVNYASAGAGILDETGQHLGDRYSLSQQVLNFESTLNQLRPMMGATNLTNYLSKSIAIMVFGSNDYINNYLMPSIYSSSWIYDPTQFANLLLNHYARQILALYSVGLRRFFLAGVGPLGCIPNQRSSGQAPPGRCYDYVNQILGPYNEGLRSLVDQLNKRPGATSVYGNTYGAVGDILNNPATFGFSVWDRACCGLGRNQGEITCVPFGVPCMNRNQYVFWDAFHPSEAVNGILARRAVYGSALDCYPMNLLNMTSH